MGSQPFPGAFFDQQVDQRQPARLVDRVSQQGLIAVVVKSFVLPTHLTPPRTFRSNCLSGRGAAQQPVGCVLPCGASRSPLQAGRNQRARGLFGLRGLRPGGFLGARGHPGIVFGRAAARRYARRHAAHPLRHVRQPFPCGLAGARRQHDACEAQESAGKNWQESVHPLEMPRQCGGLDPQSRPRWDGGGYLGRFPSTMRHTRAGLRQRYLLTVRVYRPSDRGSRNSYREN